MIAILFTVLLSPAVAHATLDDIAAVHAACEAPQKIEARTEYCSQNADVVAAATRCRDALKTMWDHAPKDVNPAFNALFRDNDGKQQVNFRDSHTDYQTTLNRLFDLVSITQDKADFVEQYPTALIDYPGAPTYTSSCFYDEVPKLQKITEEIDQMILQGQATYEETGRLHGVSLSRDGGIDSNAAAALVNGLPSGGAAPVAVPSGTSPRHSSDITGIEENGEKEVLRAFPLRDQLTGEGR